MTNLNVTFRGFDSSPALGARIEQEAAGLEKFYRGVLACRVVLERPGQRHRHGGHYRVRIELDVPGKLLIVGRDPAKRVTHEDAYAAVNEAFAQMRRQLEDYARVHRGFVKRNDSPRTRRARRALERLTQAVTQPGAAISQGEEP